MSYKTRSSLASGASKESLFTEVPRRRILRTSQARSSEKFAPEIASWYLRSTSSGDMLHLLHKKGRGSDRLFTSTLRRKEEGDGPNSRTRH